MEIVSAVKMKISLEKNILNIFAKNIDRGYTLEPPHQNGSNAYPQLMVWIKNKKHWFKRVYF